MKLEKTYSLATVFTEQDKSTLFNAMEKAEQAYRSESGSASSISAETIRRLRVTMEDVLVERIVPENIY